MYDKELQQAYLGSCPESLEKARQVLYKVRQAELAIYSSLMGIELPNEHSVQELSVDEVAA